MKLNKYIFLIFIIWVFTFTISKKVLFQGNPIVENCVACKFIWENVEEALDSSKPKFNFGNTYSDRNPILAAQAFQYFCRISPDIFYEPCNRMYEKLFFFTQDFLNRTSIEEICKRNEMCPS